FQAIKSSTDSTDRHNPPCEMPVPTSRLPEIPLQDVGIVQENISEDARQALQVATAEQTEQTKKELESACSNVIVQARNQLERQLSAALDDFGRRTNARLQTLEEEHLEDVRGKLQAQMTAEIQKSITEL